MYTRSILSRFKRCKATGRAILSEPFPAGDPASQPAFCILNQSGARTLMRIRVAASVFFCFSLVAAVPASALYESGNRATG